MAVLGNSMSGMGGAISGMNMGGMGGLSSDMERRAEDGTDFSHFGDDSSNKGNELGLDSEPQSGTGPKPRKHFRGFQRKPEANLLLLKAVLKHQPFKHGNVGPGMFPKHTKNSGLAIYSTRLQVQNHGHREDRRSLTPAHTSAHLSTSDRPRSPPPHELYQNAYSHSRLSLPLLFPPSPSFCGARDASPRRAAHRWRRDGESSGRRVGRGDGGDQLARGALCGGGDGARLSPIRVAPFRPLSVLPSFLPPPCHSPTAPPARSRSLSALRQAGLGPFCAAMQ
jgi:hypothetical protein